MKAILICPSECPETSALAEAAPLVNLCILGKPFIHCWLEEMAKRGVKEIKVLVTDRPEQVRALVGNGARWGLRIEVIPESQEMTCEEALEKYAPASETLLPEPMVTLIDHLPGFPEQKIFETYAQYYFSLQLWLSQNAGHAQIGVREIKPGVWVGLRSQISPRAVLHAPCWIGENVLIKSDVEIGPRAILENGVVVETGARIAESWVGQQTFVGGLTEVGKSLAAGSTLVNYITNSVTIIPDTFLLSALNENIIPIRSGHLLGRTVALLVILLTLPFALITFLKAKWLGQRVFRTRRATSPTFASANPASTIVYFEFANSQGWWKRWPQLWSVAQGEFTWIGNRPLTHIEAGKLTNEFERLWLAAPLGLISQGDAEGCADVCSDEARAHASFYAAQANWKLDLRIFVLTVRRVFSRKIHSLPENESPQFKDRSLTAPAR